MTARIRNMNRLVSCCTTLVPITSGTANSASNEHQETTEAMRERARRSSDEPPELVGPPARWSSRRAPARQDAAAWTGQDGEEDQVAREDRVLRVDVGSDRLRDAQHDAAAAACPTANRVRRSPQLRTRRSAGSARWRGRTSTEWRGTRRRAWRSPRAIAVALAYTDARRDADERRRVGVLCGGAHLPAEPVRCSDQLQSAEDRDGDASDEQRRCRGRQVGELMPPAASVEIEPAFEPRERTSGE